MTVVKLTVPLLFLVAPVVLIGASTPSGIALSSSPNPAVYGSAVTLTAVVIPPTATGNVTFYDGTTVVGIAKLTGGTATLVTTLLPSGVGTAKAYYGGDANYAPSISASLVQTVNAAPGGGFPVALNYSAGPSPHAIIVGDFNGDGKADLAVADQSAAGTGTLLLGNGDGTFRVAVGFGTGASPSSIAPGDFKGDGKSDLVLNDGDGTVRVLLGRGDGTFLAAVKYGGGVNPRFVAVGDFNGDGKADLAVADEVTGDNVGVLLGNGDGTLQPGVSFAAGHGVTFIAVGDFNGDGKADLAVAGSSVNVLLGNGDGTFQTSVSYGSGYIPQSVAVGDFNGDGKADLVVGNFDYAVSVLLAPDPFPELSAVLSHSGNFAQGQNGATYLITIANIGPATTVGAVAITDSLSPGLTATSISGSGWDLCALNSDLHPGGPFGPGG